MLSPANNKNKSYVQIEVTHKSDIAVLARLERGDDELAAMMWPPTHLPLARGPFLENPLVIIAGHALAQRRRLKLSELTGEPLRQVKARPQA